MKKRIRKIVKRLSKKHKIKVVHKFKGESGTAFYKERKVNVPKHLDNYEKALVCLHEIGHIVNGDKEPAYYDEYLAERFAIRTGKKYGIVSPKYERGAGFYVMWHIANDIKKDDLKLSKIKRSAIKFVSKVYDFNSFRKKIKDGYSFYDYECNANRFKLKWYRKSKMSDRRNQRMRANNRQK
jgi:Zn-dependent peptidase ImmA (M78 family)